jgi:hypothetical protein
VPSSAHRRRTPRKLTPAIANCNTFPLAARSTSARFRRQGPGAWRVPGEPHGRRRGGIQKLVQTSPSANTGKLTLFYSGDQEHTGLDNTAFLSRHKVTFTEDAGDTLHKQRNALDSGYVFDVDTDYSKPGSRPVRWLAEGRDASATIDSDKGGFGKNDGDNEITGVHVSDGDPGPKGVLGARTPNLFHNGWRWFYTQQHGDNPTLEVIPVASLRPEGIGHGG